MTRLFVGFPSRTVLNVYVKARGKIIYLDQTVAALPVMWYILDNTQ